MLVIRPEQLRAFEDLALARFERSMANHLREFSPPLAATLSEAELLYFVRSGIDRARKDGFALQGPVRLYLETMLLLGSGFSDDPQYPWAAQLLGVVQEAGGDELDRATRLYEALSVHLAFVSGPRDSYTTEGLRRLEEFAHGPIAYGRYDMEDSLVADLLAIYPQKLKVTGEAGIRNLLKEGIATAIAEHMDMNVRSIVLICVLMFAFGHSCLRDPLCPWIRRTMVDSLITDQASRARRLEARATTWLRHVNDSLRRRSSLT